MVWHARLSGENPNASGRDCCPLMARRYFEDPLSILPIQLLVLLPFTPGLNRIQFQLTSYVYLATSVRCKVCFSDVMESRVSHLHRFDLAIALACLSVCIVNCGIFLYLTACSLIVKGLRHGLLVEVHFSIHMPNLCTMPTRELKTLRLNSTFQANGDRKQQESYNGLQAVCPYLASVSDCGTSLFSSMNQGIDSILWQVCSLSTFTMPMGLHGPTGLFCTQAMLL